MLFLAFRHLFSHKRQTLFTLLGILLGSMGYVVISGFFLGFQNYLVQQLIDNDSHIYISSREDVLTPHALDKDFYGDSYAHVFWSAPPSGRKDSARIEDPPNWFNLLKADPRVVAYSPILTTQAILRQSKSVVGASIIGCDPFKQVLVNNLANSMVKGSFSDLAAGSNRIILGDGLLARLGTQVSQIIKISSGQGESVPFKIVGTFHTGIKPLDDVRAYGTLADIQKLNGTPNEINQIAVRITDYRDAGRLATTWSNISKERVQSWDQINANIFAVFDLQNATRYVVIIVILIVAGFGIYNVLNMTVVQKKKEVAILRSMGFQTSDIISLFFSQGLILGILGGVIGLLAGYWVCLYLQTVPFGGGPLGGPGYLQIAIEPAIYFYGMLLAVISSSIASILPARAAGRLTPIEIIRSGTE